MAQPLRAPAPTVPGDDVIETRLWRSNLPREHGFEPLVVEGTVPGELRGTLLRNGPGLFELFGQPYRHLFEGDGALTAIRFADGAVTGAARVTQSAGLREERAAGRVLHNFGAPWLRRIRNVVRGRQKNTANTSGIAWQGRVLALMEAGRPTEIAVDDDLHTLGETDLGGVVGRTFSAHPHRVPARRAMVNFGIEYGKQSLLRLYELPDAGAARVLGEVALPYPAMVHDFAVTARHAVVFLHPLIVDLPRLFLGLGDNLADVFRWRPERASYILVVPLDRVQDAVRFEVPHSWVWHFASARDRGDHEIVVDYVRYPDASSFQAFRRDSGRSFEPGQLYRGVIDLRARRFHEHQVADRGCEFPVVHAGFEAGAYRLVWLALDDGRALGAVDLDTGAITAHALPAGQRASEPIVVPKRGPGHDERAVWVLSLTYDGAGDRSGAQVFDGERLGDGPVATAWFDHRIPVTFHGTWVPAR